MKGLRHFFLALFLHTVLQCNATSEPACSKFDYEEKLLAKTIRLENTVDDLIKTVTKCQTDRTTIELQIQTLINDFEKQNASMQMTVMELEANVNELTIKMKDYETEPAQRTTKCPSTYMYNAELNLCWRLEKDKKMDWLTAGWHCHNEGGYLMMLDSMAKAKFIQYFLVTSANGINTVFVGGTDVMEEGKYHWINGKPVGTIPWNPGQPAGAKNEQCLVMEGSNEYVFHDRSCNRKYNFLCQISL